MIAGLGAPTAIWISALWYLVSFALLLPLRSHGRRAPEPLQGASVMRLLAGGIRSVGANRLAVAVLLVTVAANTLVWPIFQSFMPVFAERSLGLGAAGLGALLTCAGVGGLLGSVVIASLGDMRAKGAVFVLGTLAWAVCWGGFALARQVPLAFALIVLIGVFSAAFGVLQTTLLLLATEPAVHGRALGLQELAIGIMPLAALVLGQVAEHVGVGPTTLAAAVAMVLCLVLLMLRVPEILRFGDA